VAPSQTQSYTLVAADSNSCTSTGVVVVAVDPCTGLVEGSSNLFVIFPNPCSGKFSIRCNSEEAKLITIIDATGRCIFVSEMTTFEQDFLLSGFANGVYFVTVKEGAKSNTVKLVLQN
jgi:hypothetical protein